MWIAASELDLLGGMLQFGATGVFCLWFMLRNEPRQRAIEQAVQQQSKSNLLLAIAIGEHIGNASIVDQGKQLMKEIEKTEVAK